MLPEDGERQALILQSLARSLYSMETVEELRLLVDGEELELFGQIPVESAALRPDRGGG